MESGQSLSVEVTLRPSDVYTPFQWNSANIFYWVLALSASWILYDLYFAPPNGTRVGALPAWLTEIGIAIALLAVLLGLQYIAALRLFQKYPFFRKSRRITFGPGGIVIESEEVRADCKWSAFTRIQETPELFLFQPTDRTATYVPKRCLGSGEEIRTMRKLIREHFKGRYLLRPD
jgi:YcxB-like protein